MDNLIFQPNLISQEDNFHVLKIIENIQLEYDLTNLLGPMDECRSKCRGRSKSKNRNRVVVRNMNRCKCKGKTNRKVIKNTLKI